MVWSDWVALRKEKRATVSETVLAEARAEAAKADIPLEAFLRIWCLRGTQGLQASWLKDHERKPYLTAKERDTANAAERYRVMSGGLLDLNGAHKPQPPKSINDIWDMEEYRATQIANG